MSQKQSYKDLDIYKLAHQLAIEIHQMSIDHLPKFEMFEEGSQIRRSAKSIVANIVEGFGRKQYQQEYAKYINYAIASCDETKEHLDLLYKTKSLTDEKTYLLFAEKYQLLGKKLYRFRQAIVNGLKGKV